MNTVIMLILLLTLGFGVVLCTWGFIQSCRASLWAWAAWNALIICAGVGTIVICPLWNHA